MSVYKLFAISRLVNENEILSIASLLDIELYLSRFEIESLSDCNIYTLHDYDSIISSANARNGKFKSYIDYNNFFVNRIQSKKSHALELRANENYTEMYCDYKRQREILYQQMVELVDNAYGTKEHKDISFKLSCFDEENEVLKYSTDDLLEYLDKQIERNKRSFELSIKNFNQIREFIEKVLLLSEKVSIFSHSWYTPEFFAGEKFEPFDTKIICFADLKIEDLAFLEDDILLTIVK
ncbi:MAG: hypothetical protein FWF56_00060 [Firmicutes bacterium]|nr:hypothetical protein [Bacillota bacterium]MCL1953763.1 hypothetical protein [Bacillota bacterium]